MKLVPWLIRKNLMYVVDRYYGGDIEEVIQVGYLGLVHASNTYKSSKSKFSTFATICIRNKILLDCRNRAKGEKRIVGSLDNINISDDGDESTFLNLLQSSEPGYENAIFKESFKDVLCRLFKGMSLRDIEIVKFKMKNPNMKVIEVSKHFGMTQPTISRILNRVREKLIRIVYD